MKIISNNKTITAQHKEETLAFGFVLMMIDKDKRASQKKNMVNNFELGNTKISVREFLRDLSNTKISVRDFLRDLSNTKISVRDFPRVLSNTKISVLDFPRDLSNTNISVLDFPRVLGTTNISVKDTKIIYCKTKSIIF